MNKDNFKEAIGQMFIVGFGEKQITDEMKELIHTHHVGGVILFNRNIGSPAEVLDLTTNLQKEAKAAGYDYPLLICVDQENGIVRRLGEGTTIFPGAMALGATGQARNAYDIGFATGKELLSLGINWNLSPDLDVNNNPDNPVIGVRSFGESPEKVAEFGRQSMKGMQDAGMITTLKHFPGHGDTSVDSHLDLPVITHDLQRLEDVELKPFKECIAAGADTVMTAHISFPAIEPEKGRPATLSKQVITKLLREKLGYNGVVTTDCMEMNAISKTIGTKKGAVAAIKAGTDFVMISHTFAWQKSAIEEVINAVDVGDIATETILEANERIQKLKEKYLDWGQLQLDDTHVPELVGSKAHQELATNVYRNSITVVKNNDVLPLTSNSDVLVLYPESGATVGIEDEANKKSRLGEAIRNVHPTATIEQINKDLSVEAIIQKAQQYDAVIVGTLATSPESEEVSIINRLTENGVPVVVMAMRNPYALRYFPDVPAYVNTYEFTPPALQIASEALFGKEDVNGQLPVTIPER